MYLEQSRKEIRGTMPGFTLLELVVALSASALVMGVSLHIFAYAITGYQDATSERMKAASFRVANQLISGDVHAAQRVRASYGGLLSITKSTGETVSYSLNLNSHLIRQVNGIGGEIVADNVHSFSVSQGVYADEIQIQIGFMLQNREEIWSVFYSAGHD